MEEQRRSSERSSQFSEEDEMNADRETLAAELADIPEYAELFENAFPEDPRVTLENLASALAAYQRTFISDRSPTYDAYLEGLDY